MNPRGRRVCRRAFSNLICLGFAAVIGGTGGAAELGLAPAPYVDRWVYCSFNLQVDKSVDELIDLIERARRDGYTGIVLADYKFQVLYRVPDFYFRNVERVKAAADRAKIELIPAVFSIGYSNGILAQDPNLAEGLPVVDQPYLVKNRVAALDTRPTAQIKNGSLEATNGDKFAGFNWQDDPGITTFADRSVRHQGLVACRLEPGKIVNGTDVAQRSPDSDRQAAAPDGLSLLVLGEDPGPGADRLVPLAGARCGLRRTAAHLSRGGLEPTQDWKRIEVVFNSLDQREANLYAGFWGAGKGQIWIDDLAVEELALVNVLRRPGCPLTVKLADGKTTYEEGRDFEPVIDPKLGHVPWEGEFEFDHAGPAIKTTPRSRIKNGDRLRVSWYHPVITHGSQVMCCLSEPKLEKILVDQARRLNALFHPKTFFMSHDEIRVANWCLACQNRKRTPGQLLAENVRRCTAILKAVNPSGADRRLVRHVRSAP